MRCGSITQWADCLRNHKCDGTKSAKPGDAWRWEHRFEEGGIHEGLLFVRCKGPKCGALFTLRGDVIRADAERNDGSDASDMSRAALANRLSDEAWRAVLIECVLAPLKRKRKKKPLKRTTAWAKILKGVV
jgi:hypothetical protein